MTVDWNAETNRVDIVLRGKEGPPSYTYRLEIRPSELADMVAASVDGASTESSGRAFGAAMAAFLRSALPQPETTGERAGKTD